MMIFGLDVGSSGCKCVAFGEDGEQRKVCYREYDSKAGQADLDALIIWTSVQAVISECAAGFEKDEIGAISVTSFGESFVPIDKNGRELSKIIMYTDKRGVSEAQYLISKLGKERIMDITKDCPDAMFSLPKIIWSLNNIPQLEEKVYKFLLIADYICYKLSGECKINYSLACRSLAFDVENRRWSNELLEAAGIEQSKLGSLVPCGSIVGEVRESIAEELGLGHGVKVVISAHDQISAALGGGVLKPGDAADGTGSVECITAVFEKIATSHKFTGKNFVCIPFADTGWYTTYAFNFSGGMLVRWFRDTFARNLAEEAKKRGVSVYRMLDETMPDEMTDALVVPHFMGAGGTPDMVGSAKGTISGLTMKTTLPDIYRATLEGLTYEMLLNIDELEKYGIQIASLSATGGGAKSPAWLQMKADIFGRPVTAMKNDECGATGCAMLAAVALGIYPTLDEASKRFVKRGKLYEPDKTRRTRYLEKYGKYLEIRNALLEIYK